MINLTVNGYFLKMRYRIPESWNELTGRQLLAIMPILFRAESGERRAVGLWRAIMQMPGMLMRRLGAEKLSEKMLPELAWIEKDCDLTKQLLPLLKAKGGKYYGPDQHLKNITFCEFDFAERALYEWHLDNSNIDALWQFVACLYRKARTGYDLKLNPEGDVREPFNPNLTDLYAKNLSSKLDVRYALAIMLFYKGCRNYIAEQHPRIFSNPEANEGTEEAPAYFGLMRLIAKEGIHGTFNDVENMYLWNALYEMELAMDEQEAAIEAARGQNQDL